MELLDPYRFNLHTTLGHHGHSINCGHYTASINCCEKIIPTIQEFLNAISMIPTTHLLLYSVECLWQDRRGWELMHFWIRLCSYYVVVVVVVWGSIQRRWHSCLQQPSHVCTISPNSKLPLQTHVPDPGYAQIRRLRTWFGWAWWLWYTKSPNYFSKLRVSENDTEWKRHLIVCDLQTG